MLGSTKGRPMSRLSSSRSADADPTWRLQAGFEPVTGLLDGPWGPIGVFREGTQKGAPYGPDNLRIGTSIGDPLAAPASHQPVSAFLISTVGAKRK